MNLPNNQNSLNETTTDVNVSAPVKKKLNVYAIAAFITIAAMLIGGVGMHFTVSYFLSLKKAAVPKKWTAITPDNNGGLTLEAPVKFSPTQLDFPPDIKSLIKNESAYKYQSENIIIVISYNEYLNEVKADINGAAQGAIDNVKNLKEVSKFDYSIDFVSTSELSGRLVKGSYYVRGILKENFIFLLYTKENKLWQVNCIFRQNADYNKIAERIINSVKIENK